MAPTISEAAVVLPSLLITALYNAHWEKCADPKPASVEPAMHSAQDDVIDQSSVTTTEVVPEGSDISSNVATISGSVRRGDSLEGVSSAVEVYA
jgi:hypothetical protein